MKKIMLSMVFILLTGIVFGQTLSKGNILGIHIMGEYELQPGVTMEQVEDFLVNTYCPAFNDAYEGIIRIPIKALRGDNEGLLGTIYYLESDEVRSKYWDEDGVLTEAGLEAREKVLPLIEEFQKLRTSTGDQYTDWVILQ